MQCAQNYLIITMRMLLLLSETMACSVD